MMKNSYHTQSIHWHHYINDRAWYETIDFSFVHMIMSYCTARPLSVIVMSSLMKSRACANISISVRCFQKSGLFRLLLRGKSSTCSSQHINAWHTSLWYGYSIYYSLDNKCENWPFLLLLGNTVHDAQYIYGITKITEVMCTRRSPQILAHHWVYLFTCLNV